MYFYYSIDLFSISRQEAVFWAVYFALLLPTERSHCTNNLTPVQFFEILFRLGFF